MTREPCPFSPEDLVAFAYGELDKEHREALDRHLKSCTSCHRQVLDLQLAATLCATVRSSQTPDPNWTMDFNPTPVFWKRPWFILTPAILSAGAAILILFLMLHADKKSVPVPRPDPVLSEHARSDPAFVLQDTQGDILHGKAGVSGTRPDKGDSLYSGDTLASGADSWAVVLLPDSSKIVLGARSLISLDSSGVSGDRISLLHGSVACRVTPRKNGRHFLIATSTARIEVIGTSFAVAVDRKGILTVAVEKGRVKVLPVANKASWIMVESKHQVAVATSGRWVQSPLDTTMKGLLDSLDTKNKPLRTSASIKKPVRSRPLAQTDSSQQPPGITSPVRNDAMTENAPNHEVEASSVKHETPTKSGLTTESLDALVARLHNDTGWIFDDIRIGIKQGRCKQVLHKLDGYLSDPNSPRQDEALFLKAVCLERRLQVRKAAGVYRKYLNTWPKGPRAANCRAGLRRILSSLHK